MSIKLNQSLETSLSNCTLVKTQPVNDEYNGDAAERVILWLAYSQVEKKDLTSDDVRSYIRYLDAKLSSVRKTATFWDAYNIREVASTLDDFIQKYAVLPNNSSLIINTGSFKLNGKTYEHGDIIIKDNLGQEVQVKNESNSGVYYPTSITNSQDNSGNLLLTFTYGAPNPTQDIKLTLPTEITPKEGTLYSYAFKNTDFEEGSKEIDATLDGNSNIIIPFWECREWDEENNQYGDKIFNLITVKADTTAKTLTFSAANTSIPFVVFVK